MMTHLLLDPRVVARADQARLVLGTVEKDPRNPLFVEDRTWEVRFDNLYANVVFDDAEQRYRCWYNPFIVDEATTTTPPEARPTTSFRERLQGMRREMGVCYAESRDGIVWEKPALGIVEFDGSTANNLVLRQSPGAGIMHDPRDPDPARRYKLLMQKGFMTNGTATSPDGLHWSAVQARPEIEARADTHNNVLWDDRSGTYVGITRLWEEGQRIVGRTESPDFRRWTRAVEIMRALPEEPHRQPYALLAFPYAGLYPAC
jgi:hypothetical protein